jgi:pyridoxal phosphate enzyme (YggS family)
VYREIKARYNEVSDRIAEAARSVSREPAEVQLMVVTKAHSIDVVQAVIEAGADLLGENYVEEALPKMAAVKASGVSWHMIGHIQSRKAKAVSQDFAMIHSVDRLKIAKRLNRYAAESGKRLPVLLEFNVSGEVSKYGFPAWDTNECEVLVDQIKPVVALPNLEIRGLMSMPPWSDDPEESRPYYRRTVQLQQALKTAFPKVDWCELSMGMSGDYEVAVQEGATIVRIGTAILGARS